MREPVIRALGLVVAAVYAAVIGWLFMVQPKTITEALGSAAASLGAYTIDAPAFADGLAYFHRDRFVEARAAFSRADPAARDPRTQFYVAYSFYRQGWHRTYHDDELYRRGLQAVEHAIELTPSRRLVVDDSNLQMHSADELKAELEAGLRAEPSDFNPARLFEKRK
jgi:tetratricopeptide (TPR) repeat protein